MSYIVFWIGKASFSPLHLQFNEGFICILTRPYGMLKCRSIRTNMTPSPHYGSYALPAHPITSYTSPTNWMGNVQGGYLMQPAGTLGQVTWLRNIIMTMCLAIVKFGARKSSWLSTVVLCDADGAGWRSWRNARCWPQCFTATSDQSDGPPSVGSQFGMFWACALIDYLTTELCTWLHRLAANISSDVM